MQHDSTIKYFKINNSQLLPNYTSFEFVELYSAKSIRSVITIKVTEKYKYYEIKPNLLIIIKLPKIGRGLPPPPPSCFPGKQNDPFLLLKNYGSVHALIVWYLRTSSFYRQNGLVLECFQLPKETFFFFSLGIIFRNDVKFKRFNC